MTPRRIVVIMVSVFGLTCLPAAAAPLTLSSGNLTVFRTCVLTPLTGASTAGVDANARQASPTSNFGTATSMTVTSNLVVNARAYLQFDLTKCSPTIPASATVTSAVLRLFVTALPATCRTHDVFRVTSSWVETTLTWNNQPFGTSLNNPSSGSRTASLNVGPAVCQNSTNTAYVSGWDVTTDVNAFRAGTTNNGWMIRDDVEGSATNQASSYVTQDAANTSRSPQLIVNYKP